MAEITSPQLPNRAIKALGIRSPPHRFSRRFGIWTSRLSPDVVEFQHHFAQK